MRATLLVATLLFTVFLACSGSGGSGLRASPNPGPSADDSMREALLRLGRENCNLRPNPSGTPWVLEFQRAVRDRPLEVVTVGSDFVRLGNGTLHFDIPFAQILMVTSDD